MNTNPNSAPASAGKPAAEAPKGNGSPATQSKAPDAKAPAAEQPAKPDAKVQADPKQPDSKAPAADPKAEEPKPDPFADLPRIKLADTEGVLDMSGVECSNPRKYEKVHAEAVGGKLPLQKDWKHATAVFTPGTSKGGENGFKPGSVYGTIADIVSRAGRGGIAAHELVTQVRQRQVGNKRSHYCEKVPPVGWAEGWINTAVTKNIILVHPSKRAPALYVAPKGEEATPEQNKAAQAKALGAADSKAA